VSKTTSAEAVEDAEAIAGTYVNRSDFPKEYTLSTIAATILSVFIGVFVAVPIPLNYGYSFLIVLSAFLIVAIPLARRSARHDARLNYEKFLTKLASAISYFDPLIGTERLAAMLQDKELVEKLPWHANAWESFGKRIDPPTFDAVFAATAAKGNFGFSHAVDSAINQRAQRGWATLGDIHDVLPEAVRLCLARDTLTQDGLRTAFREILYTNPSETTIRRAILGLTQDHDS
jgi:hypothetical protein